MVKGDGFYQDIGQTPQSQQIPADFGVAEPVFVLFNFVERNHIFRPTPMAAQGFYQGPFMGRAIGDAALGS
jgi:hypothetical protein